MVPFTGSSDCPRAAAKEKARDSLGRNEMSDVESVVGRDQKTQLEHTSKRSIVDLESSDVERYVSDDRSERSRKRNIGPRSRRSFEQSRRSSNPR